MHPPLPPLSALRAFEAAARHLSFTLAARELNVTPGALSHQIRGLEEFLGVQLFERRTRAVALTAEGRALYPGLQAGFGLIRDAVTALRGAADGKVLVISTPPGLTAKWLVPRLYRFAEQHPEIDVRVSSTVAAANFTSDGVDIGIRSLPQPVAADPSLHCEELFRLGIVAVCSPRLVERFGRIDAGDTIRRVPLIHDDSLAGRPGVPAWDDWLRAAGIDAGDSGRGLRFTSADHAIDAALEGGGLLLSHTALVYDDVRSGRLVMPFPLVLPTIRAYHFVTPKTKLRRPAVQAFRDWVVREAEAVRAGFAACGMEAETMPQAPAV